MKKEILIVEDDQDLRTLFSSLENPGGNFAAQKDSTGA